MSTLTLKPKSVTVTKDGHLLSATPSNSPNNATVLSVSDTTKPKGTETASPKSVVPKLTIEWLEMKFPKLFNLAKPKPLKLKIHEDLLPLIQREGFSFRSWKGFVRWYVNRAPYQEALATSGSKRYDLEGNPVEPVTDEHRQIAISRLYGEEFLRKCEQEAAAKPKYSQTSCSDREGVKPVVGKPLYDPGYLENTP
jgi:sRNA-binding protein